MNVFIGLKYNLSSSFITFSKLQHYLLSNTNSNYLEFYHKLFILLPVNCLMKDNIFSLILFSGWQIHLRKILVYEYSYHWSFYSYSWNNLIETTWEEPDNGILFTLSLSFHTHLYSLLYGFYQLFKWDYFMIQIIF